MEPVVLHSIKFHLCLCELWFGVAEVGSSDFFHGLALSVGLTFFSVFKCWCGSRNECLFVKIIRQRKNNA